MRRKGFVIMGKLIGFVKPLTHVMIIAILTGVLGFLSSIFITVFGGLGLAKIIGFDVNLSIKAIFISFVIFGLIRGILRYIEQLSNHYIAFKLLAIIRNKLFETLRKLSPAKLEGRDKGNLISIITSDIELIEVFYAHTISPIAIASLTSLFMAIFIGRYHIILGLIEVAGYIIIGVIIPIIASNIGKDEGLAYRNEFGDMKSYVTQETYLFNDTIGNNIGIGKEGATLDEIQKAAKKASIDKFIESLPNGYDTNVGELGDSLSSGEKQRIGVARAFLHDAPFILLDEPTSNLDSLNEGIILKSLKEESKNKTMVLVSHRESTMNIADEVHNMGTRRVS